ncbi:MAG: hypothetical protein K8S98_14090 [Planctomycetes bacterium]|nr:hypothetical protein [Planctomycetota bacterium]
MKIAQSVRIVALTLVAPAVGMSAHTQRISPADAAALHASSDASLGSLRAGRVDAPAPFQANERAELAAAAQHGTALAALRAGVEPTHNEWTWLAIGAGIVLLIVLI